MNEKPPPIDLPIYKITTNEAKQYAALIRANQDLILADQCLAKLESKADVSLQLALLNAALIAYRRCLKDPSKAVSKEDVVSINDSALEFHDYLISMANKFAAHAVNPFDEIAVGLAIEGESVVAVVDTTMKLTMFPPETLSDWRRLIRHLLIRLAPRKKEARESLLENSRRVPFELITQGGLLKIVTPGPDDAASRRREL